MKRYALVAVGCLALGFCLWQVSSGQQIPGTKAAPEPRAEAPQQATVKELEQKRLALLEQVCTSVNKHFENGRTEYVEVLVAQHELLAARLEYAETQQDRIKVCDQAIENARLIVEQSEQRRMSAKGTAIEVLRAQEFLLQAQIARAKAEAEKAVPEGQTTNADRPTTDSSFSEVKDDNTHIPSNFNGKNLSIRTDNRGRIVVEFPGIKVGGGSRVSINDQGVMQIVPPDDETLSITRKGKTGYVYLPRGVLLSPSTGQIDLKTEPATVVFDFP
ncbi:MAG TPA: hypothetical protein VGG64_05995 [Pirellulales bacterium]|jgi:hypothetical protein